MKIKSNQDYLMALSEKMSVLRSAQIGEFEEEIKRITHANSAKGMVRSGATIKQVARSMVALFDKRSDLFIRTMKEFPFIYTKTLQQELEHLINKLYPLNFEEFREPYLKIIKLAGDNDERIRNSGIALIDKGLREVVNNLKADLLQYITISKHNHRRTKGEKALLVFEAFGVLATTFLAGMWIADPVGNYEPWIILIAAVTTGAEIYRRIKLVKET
ncbi:hypothetical protein KJ656_05510 [bacterium]|nr:hypothetical protein [bacterium]